jgi:lipopolysaccharide export system protein LptC
MASPLTRHSRLVFWLKITMPIAALAILSTLFLFARHIEFDGNLPYAEVDLDTLARDPRLKNPEFATMTADGAAVTLAAATARPGAEAGDPVAVEDVVALYERAAGARLSVKADAGIYDQTQALLTLTGNVLLATSDGYRLSADRLRSALGRTEVTADGHVKGLAPLGDIEAGTMRLTGQESGHRLVFNGGVRLLYRPGN